MANPFGASESDAIKGRTLNLTIFSGIAAAAAAAAAVFNEIFTAIFGENLDATQTVETKLTLAVAIIAAFALIVIADMLARAWASSSSRLIVTPVPGAPKAKTLAGEGSVAAMRVKTGAPDEVEYLFVKSGSEPTWESASKVEFLSGT